MQEKENAAFAAVLTTIAASAWKRQAYPVIGLKTIYAARVKQLSYLSRQLKAALEKRTSPSYWPSALPPPVKRFC